MIYLLDTNAVVALLRGGAAVRNRYRRAVARKEMIGLSAVVAFELWYGVAHSGRVRENSDRLRTFLSGAVQILAFEEADAKIAGDLRQTLAAAGKTIGPYDVMIAAQALRLGATLVTANRDEFMRVPGLAWVDWSAPRPS